MQMTVCKQRLSRMESKVTRLSSKIRRFCSPHWPCTHWKIFLVAAN